MKLRIALGLAPLLLAACGDKDAAGNASAPAAPVAAQTAPAGKNWVDTVVETPEGGFRMGNPDAALKLVEYGSRTCPHCALFGTVASEPLKAKYIAAGKVSYEFRDFMVHAPDAAAALLGRCGGAATFFPVLDQMFADQQQFLDKWTGMSQPEQQRMAAMTPAQQTAAWGQNLGYLDFMKQRGLPEPQARACMADQAKLEKLVQITNDAMTKLEVSGTPTFFLNGKKLDVSGDWPSVEGALKAAGA